MRLKRITLNNYRCFQNLEVELHPRLTVLVGENGTGKTAILDGIAAALSRILRHLSSANQRLSAAGAGIKDTDFRIASWEDWSGRERWKVSDYVQVIAETHDGLQWDYWRSSMSGKKPKNTIGEAKLINCLERLLDGLEISTPKLMPVFAYYGTQRGFIDSSKPFRSSEANYRNPTSALVGALNSSSNFKEMLKWFDAEEASELRANRGHPQQTYKPSPELTVVRSIVEILLGSAYQNPHFNENGKFVLDSVVSGKPLQVSQLSQGYQSMLALGMDFARRLAIAHFAFWDSELWEWYDTSKIKEFSLFTSAIMLVDEIDLHLHPSWQQRVLGDLMRAFPGTQFIVTTHSPQVLTTVPAECIRVLHNGDDPWIETPTQQTKGVSSADVLAATMSVDPVPYVEEAVWLSQYRGLIQQGLQDSGEGLALKQKLVGHFGERHPEMLECERLIRLETFKRKLPPLDKMT